MRLEEPATRRRGDALEAAILDAAWEQLAASGYAGFTFDAIARRARTSRPVLYRRWSTREELLEAALRRRGESDRMPDPDTGTLRGDVLALLREANRRPQRFLALLSAPGAGLYDGTGWSPERLRENYLPAGPTVIARIVERAVERGEADAARATPRIVALPFDLFRIELFMTLEALPDESIVAIVDEVFLPLIANA